MLCLAGGWTDLRLMIEYSALVSEAPDLTLEPLVLKQPRLCMGKMDGLLSSLALQLYFRVINCLLLSGVWIKGPFRILKLAGDFKRKRKNSLLSDKDMSTMSEASPVWNRSKYHMVTYNSAQSSRSSSGCRSTNIFKGKHKYANSFICY